MIPRREKSVVYKDDVQSGLHLDPSTRRIPRRLFPLVPLAPVILALPPLATLEPQGFSHIQLANIKYRRRVEQRCWRRYNRKPRKRLRHCRFRFQSRNSAQDVGRKGIGQLGCPRRFIHKLIMCNSVESQAKDSESTRIFRKHIEPVNVVR